MIPMKPKETIAAFDAFLAERDLQLDAVVIGGAALDPLDADWLNNGPASLTDVLPSGWQERLQVAYRGKAITLNSLGRLDLLRSKLFALCDRGLDLPDCVALAPTTQELEEFQPWLEHRDSNPDWPAHTRAVIDDLRQRLGHGV
jgi:hypothetical protein